MSADSDRSERRSEIMELLRDSCEDWLARMKSNGEKGMGNSTCETCKLQSWELTWGRVTGKTSERRNHPPPANTNLKPTVGDPPFWNHRFGRLDYTPDLLVDVRLGWIALFQLQRETLAICHDDAIPNLYASTICPPFFFFKSSLKLSLPSHTINFPLYHYPMVEAQRPTATVAIISISRFSHLLSLFCISRVSRADGLCCSIERLSFHMRCCT